MVNERQKKAGRLGFTSLATLVACNVSSAPSTPGVQLGSCAGGDAGRGGACPSALVVASSDYMSTNISVLCPRGDVLSESIISSGSARPGLTAALSGDVIFPLTPTPGKIVLIDQSAAVLTWVDPSLRAAPRQLNVGTGFSANPHDYLEVSATKAYVTRYESNQNPGQQANDGGGDLLVIDPMALSVSGRVPFPPDGVYLPRPDRMIAVRGEVWVSLGRLDADFKTATDARLAGVSTTDDSIVWTLDLPGLAGCGAMAIAPAGDVVAVSCSGLLTDADPKLRSAIVLVNATAHPPVEIGRVPAGAQLGAPFGFSIAFASDGLLVGVALGDAQARRNDVAYTLDRASSTARVLLDAGAAFVLGDVRCDPGCTDLCFVADAQTKALRIWKANGSTLDMQPSGPVDPRVGLPPRSIGAF